MNNPVAPIFDNDEYYQSYVSPFPLTILNSKNEDSDLELDPILYQQQPDFLVRLYLGSLTIVGLYILFRVLD